MVAFHSKHGHVKKKLLPIPFIKAIRITRESNFSFWFRNRVLSICKNMTTLKKT